MQEEGRDLPKLLLQDSTLDSVLLPRQDLILEELLPQRTQEVEVDLLLLPPRQDSTLEGQPLLLELSLGLTLVALLHQHLDMELLLQL